MIFSLERAAVVWSILERISGFDPSLEMVAPRYLKILANNGGQKIKVHDRVIRMVFPMIQRAENDRSVWRALPVYDNVLNVRLNPTRFLLSLYLFLFCFSFYLLTSLCFTFCRFFLRFFYSHKTWYSIYKFRPCFV